MMPASHLTRAARASWLQRLHAEYSQIYGAVYLLHFETEIGNHANSRAQAQHYTGFVEADDPALVEQALAARWKEHGTEAGAKIMKAVVAAGVRWHVAKIILNSTKATELDLKEKYKNARRWCPICRHEIDLASAPVIVDGGQYKPTPARIRAPQTMDGYEYLRLRSFRLARASLQQHPLAENWDDGLL